MDLNEELRVVDPWSIKGELDAVVQLRGVLSVRAVARPVMRRPKAIARPGPACGSTRAISARPISSGVKFGFMADIPGRLGRGNWTVALFVDDKASVYAAKALTWIMTGRAGGSTALLKILAGSFLGVRQVPIVYETQGDTRIVKIEKIVDGAITPVRGKDKGNVVIRNSEYWIAPDIIVSRADKSRFRLFGRNWNFEGRSAEICQLDWGNQK